MRFHAARRSASVTPFTWFRRAAALRTWEAFSSGSLRCLGNANLVVGIRLRVDVVSFATVILLPFGVCAGQVLRTHCVLAASLVSLGGMPTLALWMTYADARQSLESPQKSPSTSSHTSSFILRSKLKCPLFVAREMSGFGCQVYSYARSRRRCAISTGHIICY